ncbi:MAG: hypothetical protein HKN58_00770 [Xanthomonadales bacterium]|nr:hypothetical protein [Xanthomonadales bacterium]
MGRARTWVRRGLLAFLLLAVVFAGVLGFVGYTESGARWALRQIDGRLPGSLSATEVGGTLARGLRIGRLVFEDDAIRIEARELRLAARWPELWAGRLVFEDLQAASIAYHGGEPDQEPQPLQVSMAPLPLPITVVSGRIDQLALRGEGMLSDIRGLRWHDLQLRDQTIQAQRLQADVEDWAVSANQAAITLDGKVPLSMALSWQATDGSLSGEGRIGGSLAEMEIQQQVSGPYPARLDGTAYILDRVDPRFEATVEWTEWIIAGYPFRGGTVTLTGTPDAYTARYRFDFESEQAGGLAQVNGSGQGNLDGLDAFDAQLATESGSASATGRLSWSTPWAATAELALEDLDPGLFHPALDGRLAGKARLAVGDEDPLRLSGIDLAGTLNDHPFSARGALTIADASLDCRQCELNLGRNRLQLDGSSAPGDVVLELVIDAPQLGIVWPGLGGRLVASGTLDGSPSLPRFRGSVTGESLGWESWFAESIDVQSRGAGQDAVNMTFSVQGLAWREQPLGIASGTVQGDLDQLELDLGWALDETTASARLLLERQGEGVSGELQSLEIEDPRAGTWRLQQPGRFAIAADASSAGPLSLRSDNGHLELAELKMTGDVLVIDAMLDQLPLRVFAFLVPGGMNISGTANAGLDLRYADEAWTGSVYWRQQDTILGVTQFDGEVTEVYVPTVSMDARLEGGGATVTATVSVEPGVSGELDLRLAEVAADTLVEGELSLQGTDWAWVPVVVPQIDRMQGVVAARFRLSGPLRAPGLSGQLRWTDGALVVPALNIPLTDIDLLLEGAPQAAATVTGRARAGSGDLEISGEISRLLQPERAVNLRLTGNEAVLLDWPDYRVWGSPDLVLEADRGGWDISGDMRIPRAEITVEDAPEGAVTPSPDVVVVGAEPEASEAVEYGGAVRLQLGDNVRVQAFGLDTRLEGELLLRQAPSRPLRAEGQVTLADGVFEAYGQKLTIESGTLTFTGPLDNPLVDVRAIRQVEAFTGPVTAGIHLTGRANAIQSTVYSKPAMAEAEALSYLMLGQPLSQATSSQGSQLSGAALGLGLRHANRITDQVGRSVGLDQLTLTQDGSEGTALVAGKQINSRLYARYAYGVFSRLGTLLLRYRLSQRLTLEAGTGENQSIDLLYTVEKY